MPLDGRRFCAVYIRINKLDCYGNQETSIICGSSNAAVAGTAAATKRLQQQRSMIGRRCASFNIRHRPFAAVPSIIVDVNVAVALAAAAAAAVMRRWQPNAQSWTAYLLASCQTKLWLWILGPSGEWPSRPYSRRRLSVISTRADCMHTDDIYNKQPMTRKLTASHPDVIISVGYSTVPSSSRMAALRPQPRRR